MLTSKGEARKARKRKDQRRPLEEVRREILEQQEEQAESVEAQNVRDEILLAQEKLRSMRPIDDPRVVLPSPDDCSHGLAQMSLETWEY